MNTPSQYCTGVFLNFKKLYLYSCEPLWYVAYKQKTRCSHLQRV